MHIDVLLLMVFAKYNKIGLKVSFEDHQSSYPTKHISQKTSKSALDWRLAQRRAVLYLEPGSWSCLSRVAPVPAASLFVLEKWSLSGLQVSHCHLWLYSTPPVLSRHHITLAPPPHNTHVASVCSTQLGDTPIRSFAKYGTYISFALSKLTVLGQGSTSSKAIFLIEFP